MNEVLPLQRSGCNLLDEARRSAKLEEVQAGVDRILEIDRDYLVVEHRGRSLSVPDLRQELSALYQIPFSQWKEPDASLFCALGLYGIAWVRLEQVRMDVRLSSAISYIDQSVTLYRELLSEVGEPVGFSAADNIWARAAEVARLRSFIDNYYYRIAEIDGATWYRRELPLLRSAVHETIDHEQIQRQLCALTGDHVTVAPHSLPRAVREIADRSLRTVADATELLVTLMKAASEDPLIDADHTTVLCPRGTRLTTPWEMSSADFACYVAFNDDFEPDPTRGVGNRQLIQKAVFAHHSAKKARIAKKYRAKYVTNSSASLADDLGDMGIYFNESAHHKGHVVAGIHSAMRVLTSIDVSADGAMHTIQGLTDFRVTRCTDAKDRRFDLSQFSAFREYALSMKEVIEAALSRGIILPPMLTEWRPT